MKMDPNLEKIALANIKLLKKGKTHIAIEQAKDYLNNIMPFNQRRINKELSYFIDHVKKYNPAKEQ